MADGKPDAAADAFRQERRLWQELNAPYETARARVGLGEALLAGGNAETAALELRSAESTFERLRAEVDLRRTRALFDRIGGAGSAARAGRPAQRTFLFTDVVGSTNLIEAIGDDAWEGLLRWHDETIRHLVIEHSGEIVDHTGDGFFVAFESADAALAAADAIRHRLRNHRQEHGFAPAIRMGLHAGEANQTGSGYSGREVHVAARVAALAGAEEILASEQVLIAATTHVAHGPYRAEQLKGIRQPVRVALIE
jgi:class 3 adenylate cyclase